MRHSIIDHHASRLPTCLHRCNQAQRSKLSSRSLVMASFGTPVDHPRRPHPCSTPHASPRYIRERDPTLLVSTSRSVLKDHTIEVITGLSIHHGRRPRPTYWKELVKREGCRSSRTAQRDTTGQPHRLKKKQKNTTPPSTKKHWGWPLCHFTPDPDLYSSSFYAQH